MQRAGPERRARASPRLREGERNSAWLKPGTYRARYQSVASETWAIVTPCWRQSIVFPFKDRIWELNGSFGGSNGENGSWN